jgi:hypothetical protein
MTFSLSCWQTRVARALLRLGSEQAIDAKLRENEQ